MTVSSVGLPESYVGNGITTVFTYHSRVLLTTDMVVYVNNVQILTGFSVALIDGGQDGASVTFSVAPTVGTIIELSNEPPVTQEIDYLENTAFPANVQEFGLDKLTLLLQGIRNVVNRTIRRALRVPIAEASINELPGIAVRANKFLGFDASGQPLVGDLAIGNLGSALTVASISSLKAVSVSGLVSGATALVLSYYGIGGSSSQVGGGVFRYNSASVAAEDKGTIFQPNAGSGRWERMFGGDVYNTWFGTVGDGITDDTAAWQSFFDFGLSAVNKRLIGVKGTYLTGPLFLNGSAWVAAGKPVTAQNPAVQCFMGEGHMPFGCRFLAKPGAYPNATDAMITAWNIAGVHLQGFTLDGNAVAATLIDTRWFLPDTSNGNTFRDWWCKNAKIGNKAIIIDGAADGVNSNIRYTGGTTEVALSMCLEGGCIYGDNIYINRGRLEVAAQNMTLVNGTAFGGVKIVSASFQNFQFAGYQFSEDDTTGLVINADVTPGSFVQSVEFDDCVFLGGPNFAKYFSGRWLNGALLDGCNFQKPNAFFDETNWTVNGLGNEPTFNFRHCTFGGVGALPPAPIAGKVRISTHSCSVGGVVDPGMVNSFGNLGLKGWYGRNQGSGVIPSDAFFGTAYNRSGSLGETEILFRNNGVTTPSLRIGSWDGATFTPQIILETLAGSGFFPTPSNTWKLGRLGNLWTEVFASNATINTSDEDLKTEMSPMSHKELQVAKEISRQISIYQVIASVDKKGKDKARLHVGVSAQMIERIFTEYGLDPWRYSMLCRDYDDNGNVHLGVRYQHLILFMLRGIEARLTARE